jgi:hypothetical protein
MRTAAVGAAMPIHSLVKLGAFDPEAIAETSEALQAACEELGDIGQPASIREIVALRILQAARLGERDPVRLREAALRRD